MDVKMIAKFKVIGKCEVVERRDGGKTYPILVMQNSDCGKISVPEAVYTTSKVGEDISLGVSMKTYEGRSYLSYSELSK